MAVLSAVTRNGVKALELAAARLDSEAAVLLHTAAGFQALASRAGSLYSAPRDTAALYIIDDIRKAAISLTKAANNYRQRIIVLCRVACPSCGSGHRKHCETCGSCPGKGRGPSCEALSCDSVLTPAG